jgi:hypothetical protein
MPFVPAAPPVGVKGIPLWLRFSEPGSQRSQIRRQHCLFRQNGYVIRLTISSFASRGNLPEHHSAGKNRAIARSSKSNRKWPTGRE